MSRVVGQPLDRTDGIAKVTGRAKYAAEFHPEGMAHAVMVLATVPRGRIAEIDTRRALAAPGVFYVMDHRNAPKLPEGGKAAVNPPAGRVLSLCQDDRVHYNGQPIAVVVARSFEQARYAARLVAVRYSTEDATLDFEAAKRNAYPPEKAGHYPTDTQRGDMGAGESAPARMEATYVTPMENHNPMEPHATIAMWKGEELTLYDATQYVSGVQETVAKTLGIEVKQVRVISPYVGGGFGCKGSAWSHVVLAAMVSRESGAPVKLVVDRTQLFGPVGGRPHTEQHLALVADESGRIVAATHESTSHTSQIEDWVEPSAAQTRMLYACPNLRTTHRLVKLNLGTPTFQRAPGEATGTYALECAMDELAYAAGIDPLELRLRNYAERDPEENKPWSSKSLRECYRTGAERFGWSRRNPKPRSMRDGNTLVGWGMATATYPTNRSAASASARLLPDGTAIVRSGSQDIGTGTYTVMTQVAADTLGLAPGQVRFELGDTTMPHAPVSGGSMTVASVSPAVKAACEAARAKLIALAIADRSSPLCGASATDVESRDGMLALVNDTQRAERHTALLARHPDARIEAQADAKSGEEKKQYSMHAFGTVFAEVRIDPDLGIVRVPRIVGSYGVGRLLNAKTGRSQLIGGIVWGISMALFEESMLDLNTGRIVNSNLAEYHVPVNADVPEIEVLVVDEEDPYVNPLGAKGIGEIGITGVPAAIANAVYHATGKRVRDLPITLDKLL
jgi:xanthine dehydrogenase YagR molybdenum-binding subunit